MVSANYICRTTAIGEKENILSEDHFNDSMVLF